MRRIPKAIFCFVAARRVLSCLRGPIRLLDDVDSDAEQPS